MAKYTFENIPRLKPVSNIILMDNTPTFMQTKDVTIEHNMITAGIAQQQVWKAYKKQKEELIAAGALPAAVILNKAAYEALVAESCHRAHQAVVVSHMEDCLILVNPKQEEPLRILCNPMHEFLYMEELQKARASE